MKLLRSAMLAVLACLTLAACSAGAVQRGEGSTSPSYVCPGGGG